MLATIALTVLAGFVGIVGHEATHAATAALLGRRVAGIDWRGLDVYWRPGDPPDWRDWLVRAAPVLLGVVAAPVVVVAGLVSLPVVVGWAFFTVTGIPGDLRPVS